MSSPKIAIIIFTLYGHIAKLAESVKSKIESAGRSATIYQVAETLALEVLKKIHVLQKSVCPVLMPADLMQFNVFVFGVPMHYSWLPTQLKMFINVTGQLWVQCMLAGKYTSVFVSTGTPGSGQEATALSIVSTFIHHSIVFVTLRYSKFFGILTNVFEVHSSSLWGAGMFMGADGSCLPSALELELVKVQGKQFYGVMSKVRF